MTGENTQVQTETSPAPTAGEQTPATVAAPVSTTPPAEVRGDSSGKVAGGVEGYQEMKDRAIAEAHQKAQAKAAPTESAAAAPSTEEPAVSAGETTTTTEEIPATTTEETLEPAGETTETTTTEEPVIEDDDTPDRIRIKGLKDGHLVATANQIARAEGISFDEAYERVRPKQPAQPTAAAPAASNLRPRADVEAELETARQERRTAAGDADNLVAGSQVRQVEAVEKIEKLEKELKKITTAEEQAEFDRDQSEQTKFSSDVRASKLKAVQYWPDAGKDGTEFTKRMLELSDQYEADPSLRHHVSAADAPFFFAELTAREMKILPSHLQKKPAAPAPNGSTPTQPSTPTATRPAAVTQRAVTRPVQPAASPASGAARTTQEAPKQDFGVDNIKSVTDYERVRDLALGKTR